MTAIAGVTNLRLKFPGIDSLLFKDLSLSFRKGEKVLLLGPSGSGKSTLLQVLTGLIPNSVEVPMKAEEVMVPSSWGFVFQDPDSQFCMPYVDEEIAFVLENLGVQPEKMPLLIKHYLRQVGVELDTIHTNINTLSGGMKQRVAIASVLALEPEVLFLDEPTAMLDPEGTKEVWDTIKTVSDNRTLLIVEHKIDHIIDIVDRVIILSDDGKILADGPKEVIFQEHQHYLRDQGIWYPGVWDNYLKNNGKIDRYNESRNQHPILTLNNFAGYRGKEKKIDVKKLEVFPSEWIAVIGENGAGKSTFLLSLMNLLKTKGMYLLNGHDYKKMKRITDYVTFVFQNPEFQFVTNSVFEEIAYSLRIDRWDEEKIFNRVNELLEFYHLEERKDNHPYQLSMGQKRRLSVGAAIVKEQPILLLDEPTFGQDAKNTFAILEQLERLREKGTTIIMVTHDLQIVEHFATRVLRVDKGILIEDSSTKDKIELATAK